MGFGPSATAIARNFVIDVRTAPATEFDRRVKQPDDIFFVLKQHCVPDCLV